MNKWYEKSGTEGDVVISTRVRIARNLKEFPFVHRLSKEGLNKVCNLVCDAINDVSQDMSLNFEEIDMSKIEQVEAFSLVEKHLVSPEFTNKRNSRRLLLNDDNTVSIMVNEEDHIRIQVMSEGLELSKVYDMADKIDTLLDKKLCFAFNNDLGYLTQCPTNLGTGMRASLLMHLPALQESGAMHRIIENLAKLGLTIRGTYGEGSETKAALYQLSNQVTLGISEKTAIENLRNIAMQLIKQERSARHAIVKHINVIDRIYRSYGLLSTARLLSNDEFANLISNIRVGISENIIDKISYEEINKLFINLQPATLMVREGNITAEERDIKRAECVNEAFNL